MYDGNQVLRFENKFKSSDLVGLGKELTERKGTGNYDKERTKFNVSYVPLNSPTLQSKVYSTLNKNNIYYNTGKNVNLLNGAIITSGPEFFQSLGMKFKESDRVYQVGKKKGQPVLVPDIKTTDDIPEKVKNFFDEGYTFLEQLVGKENIVYAEVHYDEDTPHMHFYFLPVVNEVRRKVFETDNNGIIIKHEVVGKDGITRLVPIQKKDENGKNMYTTEKGKFLNCDQFWKQKGGKLSFHQMQNDFNKFITEKGFNLYRGDIGANKQNQSKLEYDIAEKKAELEELNQEKENTLQIIENSKNGLKNLEKEVDKDLLNPVKRKLGGYKEDDVSKIIEYTKGLENKVTILSTDNNNKDLMIDKLTKENKTFKNNSELIKKNKIIKEQKSTINEQKQEIGRLSELVDILNNNIESLKLKFEHEIEKWKNLFKKMCKAIDKVLGRDKPKERLEDYEDIADAINYGYYNKNNDKDKDDYEIGI